MLALANFPNPFRRGGRTRNWPWSSGLASSLALNRRSKMVLFWGGASLKITVDWYVSRPAVSLLWKRYSQCAVSLLSKFALHALIETSMQGITFGVGRRFPFFHVQRWRKKIEIEMEEKMNDDQNNFHLVLQLSSSKKKGNINSAIYHRRNQWPTK